MSTKRLTEERMGQIALALLRQRIAKEGITLGGNTKREFGNSIQKLMSIGFEVTEEEMEEFFRGLLTDLIGEAFGRQASLTLGGKR
jgi:NOL1/NOP2/fmu family ribosome biogenesis protein